MTKRFTKFGLVAVVASLLASCSSPEVAPHMRPLSKEAMMLLGKKGMSLEAPIFVRIFKEESELEVWKARDDGRFYHFKTYPICNWSGDIGPKVSQGDKQAPEGFYKVSKGLMNPNSSFHLSFNLGYPNAFDRAHKRNGNFLMVHGKCRSAGCYAMTDALIEEIYALARDQFAAGRESFEVHAFPFRMTEENLARYRREKWFPFWATLKEGYDYFETTRQLPPVMVCEKRYVVNARLLHQASTRIDPEGRCPAYDKPVPEPFKPSGMEQIAEVHVKAPGPKMRAIASSDNGGPSRGLFSGLFKGAEQSRPLLGFSGPRSN